MRQYEGKPETTGARVGIVVSRFNEGITQQLLDGALAALRDHGGGDADVEVVRVPGAFELPLAAQELADSGNVDGIVCLGAIVRGETPHFEFIAAEVAAGVSRTMLAKRLPIGFGVLTTDSVDQALARAGGAVGNKGYEAAVTVLEMVNLLRAMRGGARG